MDSNQQLQSYQNNLLEKIEIKGNVNESVKEEIKQDIKEEVQEEIKEEVKDKINDKITIEENKINVKEDLEKKIFGLTIKQWGWISVLTNGFSVIVQLNNLIQTQSAQSFSMKFIFLMIILNFWYFIVAVLRENIGFAIATMSFVIYNFVVVYYYYYGKQ
tara:strand:- start:333 stop:812 length:480 start_codon:yes stop_codon:yes gene_type:complete